MVLKTATIILSFFSIIFLSSALCMSKCVDSTGEAAINNNDVPSAKTKAIARAKWAAVEQVAGVEVKAQSVVQVRVKGATDPNSNFVLKDILQNIAWVTNVEEK